MALSKKAKAEKKEKVEAKKEEPKVNMVTVMRFNKVFNRRDKMEIPRDEMVLGYYGDIIVEE